jgi:hypothetical protein
MQSEQPLETTSTQEPEGQARPENLTVLQSAQDALAELKSRAIEAMNTAKKWTPLHIEVGNVSYADYEKGIIDSHKEFIRWLDELSAVQRRQAQAEHGCEAR